MQPALALGQRLGVGELWLKRDDAGDYGVTGSKVRKLEWLLAEAIARGKSSVLTFGGAGSNHALATAWYCRALGLRARLALSPQPRTQAVARTLLCAAAWGAELSFVPGVDDAYREALARQRASPESLLVAPGGTSLVGNLGFVEAGLELGHQLEEGALPKPEVIVLATGTMGSAAGLAVGLALAEKQAQIVAVRCSSSASASGIRAMERELREWLRSREVLVPATSAEVAVDDRQFGAGYARATEQGSAAARLALEHAGWLLEPTYTEKALAALPSHTLAKRRVLFWATQPGPMQTPEATEQVLRAVPLPLRALL